MKVYVKNLKEAITDEEKLACFEDTMRIFKRRVNRDGILQECRKREFYEKPGVRKRHKHEAVLKARKRKIK